MRTQTFDLSFSWDPKDKLAPLDASAQIILKPDLIVYTPNHDIAISTECATVRELEEWVAFLKHELDGILAAGRRQFSERDKFAKSA